MNDVKPCKCVECDDRCFFFRNLSTSELDAVDETKQHFYYNKGDVIIKQGEPNATVMLLSEGYCKKMMESQYSNHFIVEIATPRNLINLLFMSTQGGSPITVVALTDVRICGFKLETIMKIIRNNGVFGEDLLSYMSELGKTRYERIASIALKRTRGKLADTLLYLNKVFGTVQFDGMFSRRDIAELSNLSTENTIRTISQFEEEGIIRTDKKFIEIVNFDLLHQVSFKG